LWKKANESAQRSASSSRPDSASSSARGSCSAVEQVGHAQGHLLQQGQRLGAPAGPGSEPRAQRQCQILRHRNAALRLELIDRFSGRERRGLVSRLERQRALHVAAQDGERRALGSVEHLRRRSILGQLVRRHGQELQRVHPERVVAVDVVRVELRSLLQLLARGAAQALGRVDRRQRLQPVGALLRRSRLREQPRQRARVAQIVALPDGAVERLLDVLARSRAAQLLDQRRAAGLIGRGPGAHPAHRQLQAGLVARAGEVAIGERERDLPISREHR
jgi:hypothetical protein